MINKIMDIFYPPKKALEDAREALIDRVYAMAGPHIRAVYTKNEVRQACLEVAGAYSLNRIEDVLVYMAEGDIRMSKIFIEALVKLSQENQIHERDRDQTN